MQCLSMRRHQERHNILSSIIDPRNETWIHFNIYKVLIS